LEESEHLQDSEASGTHPEVQQIPLLPLRVTGVQFPCSDVRFRRDILSDGILTSLAKPVRDDEATSIIKIIITSDDDIVKRDEDTISIIKIIATSDDDTAKVAKRDEDATSIIKIIATSDESTAVEE
jgi:hypothetical protein